MRLASIDIGTVTSRLLIADVVDSPHSGLCEVERRMCITHLGEGLSRTELIAPEAIKRQVEACASFLADISRCVDRTGVAVDGVFAVATSAMRDAANRDEVLAALADVGLSVQVIDGKLEALLSFFGAISGFAEKADSSQSPILLVDVGGGSTELVLGTRSSDDGVPEIIRAHSFDIGSSRITESFFETDPPTFEEMARARRFIDTTLDTFFKENEVVPAGVIAVAGTATTVVSVRDALRVYNPRKVHGQTVTVDELSSVFERLSALSVRQRRECVGLEPDRAPVILGGIAVLRSVMDFLPENKLVVSETDLLQGILLGRDRLRV